MKERKRKILLGLIALVTLTASVMIAFATNVSGVGKAFGLAGHVANSVSATDFSVPTGSDPWGTTFDSSGLVWVALPGCDPSPICANTTPPGKLAVFNPATQTWVRSYTLPTGFGQPLFLAFDQQGRLWFPMPMTNSLGMLDTSSGTFQQWTVPTAASGPWDVAVDHNGNVWFTEHYTNQIGEFNPTKQTFTEIATPAANSDPYGITVDASNNIWFTENNPAVALIAEYTAQGQLKEYKIRNNLTVSMNLTPHLITIDHSGNIWWSEGWVSMFGELKITQAVPGTNNGVTEYSYQHVCSNCGTHTSGIAVDSYGNVWFDDSLQGEYGYMPITGGTATVYAIPTANGHSHDGLNIDSQNRVWFTEEFANKLALVTQSGIGSPSPTPTTPSPTATNPPGQGAVVGQDTFQRANQALWGTASDGQQWGGDANTASVFSIANNSGQIGGSGLYSAVLGPQVTDSEVLLSGSISKFAGANFGAVLHWTDTNDWYKAYLDGSNLIVQKKVKGAVTTLKQTAFTANAGTPYSLRFRIVGTTLYAKVWPAGSAEPSAWMITTTDNSLPSGYAGLRAQTQNGSVVSYTSFVATSLTSSGSTPTPTPTPASSPTPTPTATVLPSPTATTPPGTGGVLGQDTFQRANQALWGTASDGQQWGGDANNASVFSIVNNSGQVGGSGLYSAVLGPQATDSEVLLSGSISKFAGANFGAVLHWTDTNDWYKAYLDGSNLIVQKKVKGAVTTLKQTAFTANAGTPYSLRFRIVGTTLYAKVWPVGNSEPTNWMITTTDNSLPSGYAGLRAQTQGGSVVSYNSFMATSLTSGGSTPTPTPTPSPTVTVTPTPSPTVTVSPSPTVTVTPTPSPTPTPPPSGSTIAQDTFQRANQALWGTASDGQTWGGDANNVAAFSIANNAGTLVGDGNNYNAVLGSQVADSQILATGSINRFNYSNFGVVLRWQDTNNWYKAYIDGANLVVQKKVNGVITTLGTAPFTAAANTSYNILFQAVGTTLSAKVWPSNTAVPGNWMVTANDSSFQSGYCGLRISAQPGSTVSYTAFTATQLP